MASSLELVVDLGSGTGAGPGTAAEADTENLRALADDVKFQ